jgi:outer membrane biosynthesis protein TonB
VGIVARRVAQCPAISGTGAITSKFQSVASIEGDPLLEKAADEAVRQWRFAPQFLNGELMPGVEFAIVKFSLPR